MKQKRRKKKKLLVPKIVKSAKDKIKEVYGLDATIKEVTQSGSSARHYRIIVRSPTKVILGSVSLKKTIYIYEKMWIFGEKEGMFCTGGAVESKLAKIKTDLLKEYKGKLI